MKRIFVTIYFILVKWIHIFETWHLFISNSIFCFTIFVIPTDRLFILDHFDFIWKCLWNKIYLKNTWNNIYLKYLKIITVIWVSITGFLSKHETRFQRPLENSDYYYIIITTQFCFHRKCKVCTSETNFHVCEMIMSI